ncbi:MAG: MalY/PatB family protein [Caldicoprobacterales bacterium]
MVFDFDKPIERSNTHSVKWDNLDTTFGAADVLPMWVADMDFACPKPILDSIEERNRHGIFGYTTHPDSLYESVIGWMKKRHGWNVAKEWILYSPGVVTSLNLAIMSFTQPGDSVIIQSPVYPPFFSVVKNNDRTLVVNPLIEKSGYYSIDFKNLEDQMASGCKMMILCSPHNPVGRVWTRTELDRIAKLCEKYEVLLISDEIHSDLIMPGHKHTPIATVSQYIKQNSVTCIAPSKTFNVPGLTTSAVIIPNPKLRMEFKKTINGIGIGMSNVFGMVAMEAAYTHGESWLEDLIIYLDDNINCLMEYLETNIPEIKVTKPQGTYLVWLDCRALNMDGKTLHKFMINKGKLGLNNGLDFGPDGEGFLRMNIACPRVTLEEGLNRLNKAVKAWRNSNNQKDSKDI